MYSPLYVKTDYSLLSSLIKIDNLMSYLNKYNIASCAVVDDNLFGTMEIVNKFKKNNIKPVIGLEININNEKILLYCKNEEGYKNLIKIETIKNEKELDLDVLKEYYLNIICVCFLDCSFYKELSLIYSDLFIGVSNKKEEYEALKITKNVVYTNVTLYLEKYEYKYFPYLKMIKEGKTISEGIDFVYQDNYLYTNNEVTNLVSIDSLNNTLKITDMCDLSFNNPLYMPKYDVEDSKKYLVTLSRKGLDKRLNNKDNKKYLDRLNYELDIILKMHFEDYFLVVYDYIRFAKKNNILVGPGRGSAAGSLVCYCLGITDVDPIKYDLLFERFLNPERISMPDIDTDFPDTERDKVIDYVRDKYGDKRVAGIITFGTLKAKQAVRDAGRVLNIPISDIDYICKKLGFNDTLKDLMKKDKEINNFISNDEKLKLLYNLVSVIENNKRHTSVHAAGIVMSYKNLDEILPIIKNDDLYLTEYTMEYLEEIGLIKMDFLGIKNLSVIKNVIDDIKRDLNIEIDFNNISLDDPKVTNLFSKADTSGIFQFESDAMRKFLRDMQPRNFDEICAAIALFRPGPAVNIPSFIKRKNGQEKIEYYDKRLEEVLKSTYGLLVYQEQIMQIANIMASYTLGEADLLRKAMSKKKYDILKQEESKFVNNAIKNGYSKEISKKVFDLILNFANYGFNKSHSVSYSVVAYKQAYLKCYYPKYFYGNLLYSVLGSETKTLEYLNELKKIDVKILTPCVNKSLNSKYRVLEEGIMLPLSAIRNVGGVISDYIVNERLDGYIDIYDFLKRTFKKTNNKKVLESLIYAHTFDCFNLNINTLINNLESMLNYVELSMDLEDDIIPKPEIVYYDELDTDILLEKEKEVFGYYLTSHKSEKYKLNYKNITDVHDLSNMLNKTVNIIVSVNKTKEITTKKNENMVFITGSDNTGDISITVFPKLYDTYSKLDIKKGLILKVVGNVEKRYDEYQIIAKTIEVLN